MDISRIKMYSITLSYTVCWISAMTMIAVETLKRKKERDEIDYWWDNNTTCLYGWQQRNKSSAISRAFSFKATPAGVVSFVR